MSTTQQHTRASLHQSTRTHARTCAQLSHDCRDLIDRILVNDATRRISLREIVNHRWFSAPLPELYQAKLDKLDAKQKSLALRRADLKIDQVCCVFGCLCSTKATNGCVLFKNG
jgi:serine/threonine protein kinase